MPPGAPEPGDEEGRLGALNGAIAAAVAGARRAQGEGRALLLAGGNCHHATGVLGGLQEAQGADTRIGLVWFDAHGDFNTPHTTISGMLGGMPLAVCAGLALPRWREGAHIGAPLPTNRIILVGARNLDASEEALLRATDVVLAAPAPGLPGAALAQAVADLAAQVDLIYLHIDADILDAALQPNHSTVEPGGPDLEQTLAAVETVMATGKVAAYAVVSVFGLGPGREISVASGSALLRGGLEAWQRHGMA
jgi:arginase